MEIYITGYPRSGNTWLNRLLSDILDSPLQNTPDMEPIYYGAQGGKYTILKRHSREKEGPTIFIYRDPRDVAVSRLYYRLLPDLESAIIGMGLALNGDQNDVTGALIGEYEPFIRSWWNTGRAEAQVSYESLHADPVNTLMNALYAVTGEIVPPKKITTAVNNQAFDAYITRHGKEHAMRKGIAGDWQNHFNKAHGKQITDLFGELMLEQGYIQSLDWYNDLPDTIEEKD